jgi:hypothetical protein
VVISRCMAKDKSARYSSARELAGDLRKMNPTGGNRPTQRIAHKPDRRLSLTALIVIAAVVFSLFYFFRKQDTAPPATAQPIEKPAQTSMPESNKPEPKHLEPQQVREFVPEEKPQAQTPVLPKVPNPEQGFANRPPFPGPPSPGGVKPPRPPFFPPRPGGVPLVSTTWHMELDGSEVYFHFTPQNTLYTKADFVKEGSTICGNWIQNASSIVVQVCNGSMWEGTHDGNRIRWRIIDQDGTDKDDVYSEQAESPVNW